MFTKGQLAAVLALAAAVTLFCCAGLGGLGLLAVRQAMPNAACPVCGQPFHLNYHNRVQWMFEATCPYCGTTLPESVFKAVADPSPGAPPKWVPLERAPKKKV